MISELSPKAREYAVADSQLSGLSVRVRKSGTKTWIVRARDNRGQLCRITLGNTSCLSPQQARARGEVAKAELRQGITPRNEDEMRGPTANQFFETYLQRHAINKKRPRTIQEDKGYWRRCLGPALGKFPMRSITQRDIQDFMEQHAGCPIQANRSLSLIKHMFSCWRKWEYRTDDPCQNISTYSEHFREVYLDAPAVAALFDAADHDADNSAAAIVKLGVLTGARASEILKMRWSELSDSPGGLIWTLPASKTKQREANIKALNAQATSIIQAWKSDNRNRVSPWVFPALSDSQKARHFPTKSWQRIRRKAGFEELHFHDLRHTFASLAIKGGASLELIGKNMGHTRIETTHRYAHIAATDAQKVSSVLPTF